MNNAPGALAGSGLAMLLATWVASSHTSMPAPGVLRMMIE
jgi:hypothetical protein